LFCPCIWPLWPVHPLRHLLWHFGHYFCPCLGSGSHHHGNPTQFCWGCLIPKNRSSWGTTKWFKIIICFLIQIGMIESSPAESAHVSFTRTSIWRGSWFENKTK
jgi:hypothetical protein